MYVCNILIAVKIGKCMDHFIVIMFVIILHFIAIIANKRRPVHLVYGIIKSVGFDIVIFVFN